MRDQEKLSIRRTATARHVVCYDLEKVGVNNVRKIFASFSL